jgi:uncharacterized glyoxalase superfamily protein PhnB
MDGNEPTLYPVLRYLDAKGAIDWLERTFGFQRMVAYEDKEGVVRHAELSFGTGVMMLGTADPTALPGFTPPYVYLPDPDAHHARASEAGAEIVQAPWDTEHGSREYTARDIEGNEWYFGTYRPLPPDRGRR